MKCMKGLSGIDLLWMIRQEDNFLVLILYHEVLEVVPSSFTLKVAETQERLVYVVRVSDTDIRYLLNPNYVVHVKGIKADKRKI